jgi:hypothetical protein
VLHVPSWTQIHLCLLHLPRCQHRPQVAYPVSPAWCYTDLHLSVRAHIIRTLDEPEICLVNQMAGPLYDHMIEEFPDYENDGDDTRHGQTGGASRHEA